MGSEATPTPDDSELIFLQAKRVLIPPELHSVFEKGPFKSCCVCSVDLGCGCLYELQKVYRGKEVVFEMAVCQKCAEVVSKEFSEESMEALKSFLLSNFKPSSETTQCNFCGIPRALASGYAIVGACKLTYLLSHALVLCDRCNEQLVSVLSKKTRDAQEEFMRNNFPGVPADLDLSPTLGGLL